jgi:hypothetical protein
MPEETKWLVLISLAWKKNYIRLYTNGIEISLEPETVAGISNMRNAIDAAAKVFDNERLLPWVGAGFSVDGVSIFTKPDVLEHTEN